ncbi:Fe(3+)-citrate-binding protein YfmC [Corynebacterium provencense]|uniref:Fe(3+)-citrate-binding protein YfmC n=2 Tax=Corynebacteriaceae TaxID=1653 RepID=A0A2Z3YZ84_9CORY|nr:Fe(3+)-citrate-binding protein YfmC [Corynebacterium provencense]
MSMSQPTSRARRRGIPATLLRSTAAVVLAAAVGVTASCSSRSGTEETPSDSSGAFSVVDQRGKTVEFDSPIESAAFAVIPAPSIFAAVDGSYDRIVGVNQSTLSANQQGLFSTIFPQSASSPVVAGPDFVPNVDTLLNLHPDVVIQWGDRGPDVIDPIENSGMKVIGLEYGTQEDLETWITVFSQLLGKEERGKELVEWQQTRRQEIEEKVAGLDKPRPRAMQLSLANDAFTTTSDAGYDGFQYDLVGADQVTRGFSSDNQQASVSVEQILKWDPEVILLSGFDESTPEDIYSDPRLSEVSAVKNKRVYKNPLGAYRWQVPSAESPLYWQWLNEVLYPDPDTDLRDRMKSAFSDLYNYDISDREIDDVLRFDVNTGSADYDQFAS